MEQNHIEMPVPIEEELRKNQTFPNFWRVFLILLIIGLSIVFVKSLYYIDFDSIGVEVTLNGDIKVLQPGWRIAFGEVIIYKNSNQIFVETPVRSNDGELVYLKCYSHYKITDLENFGSAHYLLSSQIEVEDFLERSIGNFLYLYYAKVKSENLKDTIYNLNLDENQIQIFGINVGQLKVEVKRSACGKSQP
jgi:hypothetical protein